jgi:peptidyl-prolyl cis-trans isomerase B (cyclophilin B)
MKRILSLLLPILLFAPAGAIATDVAVMEIRFPDDKNTRRVVIELDEEAAPLTVENFKRLAKKRFYKGTAFHRAFPDIMVQVGDPYSKRKDRSLVGTGGPGYTIPAEIKRKHGKGTVAMARLPDRTNPSRRSNGSQFYVTFKRMPELDGKYTVFGDVIEGLDVLETISRQPVDTNDNPRSRFEIRSVKVMPIEEMVPVKRAELP